MKHIRRNIYRRRGRGLELIINTNIAVDKDEPFVGIARFHGTEWVIERENGKWIINSKYSRAVQRDVPFTAPFLTSKRNKALITAARRVGCGR